MQWSTKFGREAVRGVVEYARGHTNWRLVALHRSFSGDELAALQGDAVIGQSAGDTNVDLAHKQGLPMVVLASSSRRAPSVLVDDVAVGRLAAEHLQGLGLRHFAYVWQSDWLDFVEHRLAGLTEGLKVSDHASNLIHRFISDMSLPRSETEHRLQRWLIDLPKPCGLLAANDLLAAEVIDAASRSGLRVPDDLAVVGVDDDELANSLSEVPLTSVVQPSAKIGYEGARLLDKYLDDGGLKSRRRPPVVQLAPDRLVTRASSDTVTDADPQVAAALRLIRDHAIKPIDVAWVVRQLPVTRRTLERHFRAQVGRSILEQIRHVRLERAKELLIRTDLPVEVVARQSGFRNARWLADQLRKHEGSTPTALRRQHLQRIVK